MSPDQETRIASVIRALSDIVLPAIPEDEQLALEQLQLSIGHLSILAAELSNSARYLEEEMNDRVSLAKALITITDGESGVNAARNALETILNTDDVTLFEVSERIQGLISSVSDQGSSECKKETFKLVLAREDARAMSDRRWFAPMGFDAGIGS